MNGVIKKVVSQKGFGFITPSDGGDDVFFHMSSTEGVTFDELREGDAVEYEIEQSPKGPRAAHVKRAAA